MKEPNKKLQVESSAFKPGGRIPTKYTGRGEDVSPELKIQGLLPGAKSIVVIMDDHDIPVVGIVNHWVMWNLPVQEVIPENIPHGAIVPALGGAVQGIGYGKHRYKGPKPPSFIKKAHRYQFHVYALDCVLKLSNNARKKELLENMKGHILQHGSIIGIFSNK